jgi:hypothetical protein
MRYRLLKPGHADAYVHDFTARFLLTAPLYLIAPLEPTAPLAYARGSVKRAVLLAGFAYRLQILIWWSRGGSNS